MLMNKTKILWWIIALLAVFNMATLTTIFVHNYNEKANAEKSIIIEPGTNLLNGRYFRRELGFDDKQMDVFRQSHRIFHREADQTVTSINIQKELMFKELQSKNPDTIKLNTISKEIGLLHTQLKEATVQFYLSLAKVCNTEQKEKMNEIFTPLFIELPESHCENKHKYENSDND